MAVKLYRCKNLWVKASGHPCWRVQKALDEQGIQTGIHYPIPVHLQPAYADLGHRPGDFPVAEAWARECLSLPIYPELTDEQRQRVVATVAAFFAGGDQRGVFRRRRSTRRLSPEAINAATRHR